MTLALESSLLCEEEYAMSEEELFWMGLDGTAGTDLRPSFW